MKTSSFRRRLGAAVAGLGLTIGAVGVLAAPASAEKPANAGNGNSPDVECGDATFIYKADSFNETGDSWTDVDNDEVGGTVNLEFVSSTGGVQKWTWTATDVLITNIVLKGGQVDGELTFPSGATSGTIEWTSPPAMSHITFCGTPVVNPCEENPQGEGCSDPDPCDENPQGEGCSEIPQTPPAPLVVTSPIPDASIAECAVNGGPGIVVTLRNTGTADAVFTVVVNGAAVGDAETLTVTPTEGTETLSIPQAEDEQAVVQVSAAGYSTELTLAGDCEAVLSVGIPAEPAAESSAPPAEVAGVQQTRVLARTGASNGTLLMVAGLLLTLGGLSLYGSSRLRFDR